MKRIAVLYRFGHKLAEEAEACLMALNRGGIPAHLGNMERADNILWIEEDENVRHAIALASCSWL
jgi:hypothetical protein